MWSLVGRPRVGGWPPLASIWTAQIGLGGLYILKKKLKEEETGWGLNQGGMRGECVKIHCMNV